MSIITGDISTGYQTINVSSSDIQQNLNTDFVPSKFQGLSISSFGNSKNNPFFKLKDIAMNNDNSPDDRMRAIRFMNRIPHKEMMQHTIKACINIINDDQIPIGERYFFFSNNVEHVKLNEHVARECHIHYFNMSRNNKDYPIMFRLLTAQYIYMSICHTDPLWMESRKFLIDICTDDQETVHLRSEAADILCKQIVFEDYLLGEHVIDLLGSLYLENKFKTIYTNAQNAHNETISESVMSIIRTLALENRKQNVSNIVQSGFTNEAEGKNKTYTTGDVFECLLKLTKQVTPEKRDKILNSFNMILIHPSKYEGLTLSDILTLIWRKIQSQEDSLKTELELRLMEELHDMDKTCAFGHVSRLVNVLTGYVQEENLQIKMNIKDQLRSNVFARLSANLRLLPNKHQEDILLELGDSSSTKETAKEFIESYSVYDELKVEFIESNLMEQQTFDEIYQKCILEFLGL